MKNLDRMRQAAANKPVVPPKPPKTPPPPPKPKQEKGKNSTKQPILVDSVTHSCGHVTSAANFRNSPCPGCIAETKKKRTAKGMQTYMTKLLKRHLQKSVEQKEKIVTGLVQDMGGEFLGRLPSGASKSLLWINSTWRGTMTVPGVSTVFQASAESEIQCLHALHALFIDWYEKNKETFSALTPAPNSE